jgi:hypothetical protein
MSPVFTMSGCDHQGRPWLHWTREWLDAFDAERGVRAAARVEVVHRHSGEVLEVATQALERIEEVVLAVELGNRCVNASHIGSRGNIAQ